MPEGDRCSVMHDDPNCWGECMDPKNDLDLRRDAEQAEEDQHSLHYADFEEEGPADDLESYPIEEEAGA